MINQSLQFIEINEDHKHEQGVYACSTELCPGHIYVTLQLKTSLDALSGISRNTIQKYLITSAGYCAFV